MTKLRWLGVLSVVAGVGGVGCGGEEAPAQSPTTTQGSEATAGSLEDDQATVELNHHHQHHHGGFVGFVIAATETVGVSPEEQAKLDKIKADFKAKVEPVRAANAAVMSVIADGVAAGAIDQAKVDAALAGVQAAAASVHGATADALNQLHEVLKPEERAALVDKIEAHWSIWKSANAGDQAADNRRADGHLAHLAQELNLAGDQVDKVRANLDALPGASRGPFDPAAGEAHMRAFATAFASNQFDARALATADPANTKIASWGAARMVRFYQALTPVLTADQRTKVSALLREHANEP